jgi:hypothetical protein
MVGIKVLLYEFHKSTGDDDFCDQMESPLIVSTSGDQCTTVLVTISNWLVFIDQEKSSAMKYVGAIIRSPNPMYKS